MLKIRLCNSWITSFLLTIILATGFVSQDSIAEDTCCRREVRVLPFKAGPGYKSFFMSGAPVSFVSRLHHAVPYVLDNCPLKVTLSGSGEGIDYFFIGTLYADKIEGTNAKGELVGRFSAKVQLIDPDNEDAVLREESISWTGTENWAGLREWYEPSQDTMNASWFNHLEELGGKFLNPPFNQTIYDYERMIKSCQIEMDQDKIEAGERATIHLRDLVDHQGQKPQPWQRIFVLTSLGKVFNGVDRWCEGSDNKVFKVGNGSIDIEYEAPELCENDTEDLSIFNSCTKGGPLTDSVCHEKIQSKDFEITVSLPESLKIRPAKTEINAGETIQILLTDIKDQEDKTPPPKKKIIVQVEKGFLITQGQKSKALSLPIGAGKLTLIYEAPSECKPLTDKITVKNHCVDKSKKERGKTIAEKNLSIKGCPEATLIIKRRVSTTKFSEKKSRHSDKHCNYYEEDKYDYEKIEEAMLYIPLKFFSTTDLPNVNQRLEYYQPLAINISSFNIVSKETTYSFRQLTKGTDCPESTTKTTRYVEGTGSDAKFEKEYLDLALKTPHVIVVFDRKTKKAVKVGFDDYDFHYQWNITDSYQHESWREKEGKKVKNDEKVKTETERYYMSPVGDRVEDSTEDPVAAKGAVKDFISEKYGIKLPEDIAKKMEGKTKTKKSKKLIYPDVLVKHGDGITYYGGEGIKIIDKTGVYPHDSTMHEERNFKWEMTRTIK